MMTGVSQGDRWCTIALCHKCANTKTSRPVIQNIYNLRLPDICDENHFPESSLETGDFPVSTVSINRSGHLTITVMMKSLQTHSLPDNQFAVLMMIIYDNIAGTD